MIIYKDFDGKTPVGIVYVKRTREKVIKIHGNALKREGKLYLTDQEIIDDYIALYLAWEE